MRIKPLIPAVLWGLLVLIMLGMPGHKIPRTIYPAIAHADKLIHVILFMIAGLLLAYGFFRQEAETRWHRYYLLIAFLSGTAYGAVTEWLQYRIFSGRHGSIADVVADAVGTALGVAGFRLWIRWAACFKNGRSKRVQQADGVAATEGIE